MRTSIIIIILHTCIHGKFQAQVSCFGDLFLEMRCKNAMASHHSLSETGCKIEPVY